MYTPNNRRGRSQTRSQSIPRSVSTGPRVLFEPTPRTQGKAIIARSRSRDSSMKPRKRRKLSRKPLGRAHGGPGYAGRFRRARRVRRKVRSKTAPFYSRGFCRTQEITGTINDVNCVYLTVTANPQQICIELLAQAMVRKVFKKAGINITDVRQTFSELLLGAAAGNLFRLAYHVVDAQSDIVTQSSYDILTTDSILSICGNVATGTPANFVAFIDQMQQYASTPTGMDDYIPGWLMLYHYDTNVPSRAWLRSNLNLQNEIVHVLCKVDVKIQNRTASATGSTDAENVSANPLVGRSFLFNGPNPTTASTSVSTPNRAVAASLGAMNTVSGVFEHNSSSLGTDYSEPVKQNMFSNCVGSTGITLDPGVVKQDTFFGSHSMKFSKFLMNMRYAWAVNDTHQSTLKGRSKMYVLEDMINVNAAQEIQIAYEVNRHLGIYLSTGKTEPSVVFYQPIAG